MVSTCTSGIVFLGAFWGVVPGLIFVKAVGQNLSTPPICLFPFEDTSQPGLLTSSLLAGGGSEATLRASYELERASSLSEKGISRLEKDAVDGSRSRPSKDN